MRSYSELVRGAVIQAREKQKDIERHTVFTTRHDSGAHTVTRFYKKGSAIWCEMIAGCIREDSRVYKVNTDKPYIRDMGKYWYLSEQEKEAVKYLLNN
jgi:hypothetical protein